MHISVQEMILCVVPQTFDCQFYSGSERMDMSVGTACSAHAPSFHPLQPLLARPLCFLDFSSSNHYILEKVEVTKNWA